MARCDDPVINFGVHPGELHSWRTLTEQSVVGVDTNAIGRAAYVPINTLLQLWEEFFQEGPIACCGGVAVKRVEHPEGCIGGVVLRSFPNVREAVGNKAFMHKGCEGFQQATRFTVSPCAKQQTG